MRRYYISILSVISLVFILVSCSLNRNLKKQLPESLCNDIRTLRAIIETDSTIANEFNFSSPDSIVFYSETCIHAGFQPFLLFRKINDLVAQNKSMSTEEAYLQLEKSSEKIEKIQVSFPKGCIKNTMSKDTADLLIQYWYNPADSTYSVEIEKILHQPGYSHGYVIEYTRTDSGFVQTNSSVWVE
ncbi:MAG: hypothetical protein AB7V36_07380 [Bacteroidales bacterium]